ncbi:hypothetical protein KKE92_05015 [Candidatus Micrarchaeota archaeon]|nr:hypothetical protein [Candidatus Micrarchaeota archaeon]MBU1682055.1 hypothetical protein [Candidatus Micrarchaeota archaeon]
MKKNQTRSLIHAKIPVKQREENNSPLVVGNPYSGEQILQLISLLQSEKQEEQLKGLREFLNRPNDVIQGALECTEVPDRYFVKVMLETANENKETLISEIAEDGAAHELKFIAQCSFLSSEFNNHALEALRDINPDLADSIPEQTLLRSAPVTGEELNELVGHLNSELAEDQVIGAVEFISNYHGLVLEVSVVPELTVTELTSAAVDVIEHNQEEVIGVLEEMNLIPELHFASEFELLSTETHALAKEALIRMGELEHVPIIAAEAPKSKRANDGIASIEPELLFENLSSQDEEVVIGAVVEYLKDYDDIVESISHSPDYTVTELNSKAFQALVTHMDKIIEKLALMGEIEVLQFISFSILIPQSVRLKALKKLKDHENPKK